MGKIEHYGLETSRSVGGLVKDVERAIKEGWQPLGGVAALPRSRKEDGAANFAQAIVKYERRTYS